MNEPKQMVSTMEIALAEFLRGKMQRLRNSYTLAFEAGWNARGVTAVPGNNAVEAVVHSLDKAEGEQPDLNILRLQVAERGSLLEHWLQLTNACDVNLSDLEKETRALLDSERPSWQQAAQDVLTERRRQIFKGYTAAQDDHYSLGELTSYAVAHALIATGTSPGWVYQAGICQWQVKIEDPRTMLITAAALVLAELERLDRAAESAGIEAELLRLRQTMLDVAND